MTAGTELDRRFHLTFAFTSFETSIRRARGGLWEEGQYTQRVASGLHTLRQPDDPPGPGGGVEVQRTFHAHSFGPRLDFFPLGSQGPYLGVTTAMAMIQGVDFRAGANLGARVGGEWRPFHAFAVGIEAGAQGQIYDDANATIPYVTARMQLFLDPAALSSAHFRRTTPMAAPPQMQRNLTVPGPGTR